MKKADLLSRARTLASQQHVGVLCTAVDGLPYGSPLAFVAGDQLEWIVFASPRATRKNQALARNPEGAFVIDNRSESGIDLSAAEAFIATGAVEEVFDQTHRLELRERLRRRYPNLEDFLLAGTTVIFKLKVRDLVFVEGFGGGVKISPGDLSAGSQTAATPESEEAT